MTHIHIYGTDIAMTLQKNSIEQSHIPRMQVHRFFKLSEK